MIIEVNGTNLLQFAVKKCSCILTLWILENNIRAKRLYHRLGFRETGTVQSVAEGLDEIEFELNS